MKQDGLAERLRCRTSASLAARRAAVQGESRRCPRILAFFLVWLLGLAALPPSRAADALLVDANEYPWSAIGRINTAGRGFCTGFLVGPRTALTAAHCLYNRQDGRWYHPDDVHFVAGYQRDRHLAHSRAQSYVTAADYRPKADPNLETGLTDWAVITLTEPIGDRVGWLGLQRLDDGLLRSLRNGSSVLLQAGYRRERSHAIAIGLGCALADVFSAGRMLLHDCDVTEGASGSPLLVSSGDSLRVLGLHSLRAAAADGRAYGAVLTASIFDPDLGAADAIAAGRKGRLAWDGGRQPRKGAAARDLPLDTVARLLARLGYLGQAETAASTPARRKAAIEAFEQDNALPLTGEASMALLARLTAALR